MNPRLTVVCLLLAALAGCSQQLKPIFEEPTPPIEWPPPPAPARIRYVGQLRTSADLKPPVKPFQAIGDLLVGREEPSAIYGPRAIVRTSDGSRLWVADPGGRCLHVLNLADRSYKKIEAAGGAHLLSPVGLCLGPDDSIWVCDSETVAIHRLSAQSGAWLTTLRLPEDIRRPAAIWFDGGTGELFVADVTAHDIKVLDAGGGLRRTIGKRGTRPGEFNFPSGIAGSGDTIWIADTGNCRVQGLSRSGEPVALIGQAGDAPGDLAMPKAVALDSEGHIYVVDARFENVQVFDRAGRLLLFFGQEGTAEGEFWLPAGIYIDSSDRIWICDSYNGRLQVFDYLREAAGAASSVAENAEPPE